MSDLFDPTSELFDPMSDLLFDPMSDLFSPMSDLFDPRALKWSHVFTTFMVVEWRRSLVMTAITEPGLE